MSSQICGLYRLQAQGPTAISQLTAFWEFDVTATDRIGWDSHGSKHAMYVGSGLSVTGDIFSGGFLSTGISGSSLGGMSVPSALFNPSGTFCFGTWAKQNNGAEIIAWKGSFGLRYDSGRPRLSYTRTDATTTNYYSSTLPTVSVGTTALIWFCYDSGTGQLKLAVNGSSWENITPSPAFQNNPSPNTPLDFGQSEHKFNPGATVGRTMFWDGYIPTDAERSAIYNGGAGRDYTYFNAAGYIAPTRPLTLTLVSSTFAEDSLLANPGLYFLRPYPLKTWNPTLAGTNGDYVWFRSTDHAGGGIYRGYSASPSTLPSSWTLILAATAPSADDPTYDWTSLETPYLAWNNETSLFHLYAHAVRVGSSSPIIQTTHVWTSPDLATWTWAGVAFPNVTGRNHTGYAIVRRTGVNQWIANTLLTDSTATVPNLSGYWTSTDGLSWTLAQEETATADNIFSSVVNDYLGLTRTDFVGSGYTANNYIGIKTNTWTQTYPQWRLFDIPTLQGTQVYEENGNVWVYAKNSFGDASSTSLFTGTLPGTLMQTQISGNVSVSGNVQIR